MHRLRLRQKVKSLLILVGLMVGLSGGLSAQVQVEWDGQSQQLWDSGPGMYNYAPTVIKDGDVYHMWWCQNEEPYQVRDYIYYRQAVSTGSGLEIKPASRAIGPGVEGAWDSVHVCDPAVVKGRFIYKGEEYSWALFYLGTDQWDNKHNQIGVAFAKDVAGPWVKYKGNPIVECASTVVWGVGQPAVTSIDGKGRMLLFYTRGDANGTYMYRRELNLADMSVPEVGNPVCLPQLGLRSGDGISPVVLHNGDLAYDPSRDQFFLVRPRHPFAPEVPSFVSATLQIATTSGAAIWSGTGEWQVLGAIGPESSGKPRNHNSCIVRSIYGTLPDSNSLEVVFSVGETGENWLWSYELQKIAGEIVE